MDHRPHQDHDIDNGTHDSNPAYFSDVERQHNHQRILLHPPLTSSTRSTAFLDGLRGLAALFVFIQHFIGRYDGNVHEQGFGQDGSYYLASLPFLRILFSGGSASVAIFFVLSGYVLSKSPLTLALNGNPNACATSLASATIRRPLRLYIPTLNVALAFALLLHAPFSLVPSLPWRQPKSNIFAELANWLDASLHFFNPFRTHGSDQAWYTYNIVAWTIPIELKGSMLIYVLTGIYAFSGIPQLASLTLLAVTVVVLLQIGKWTMACFIAGLIISVVDVHALDAAFLARRSTRRAQALITHAAFFVGYFLLCLPAHDGHPSFARDTPGYHHLALLTPRAYDRNQYYRYWHSWGAVLLLYAALRIRWLQAFLGTRPLRYLGRVSFMLYLVHLPVLAVMGDRVARALGQVYVKSEPSRWDYRVRVPDFGPVGMSSRCVLGFGVVLPVALVVSEFGTRVLDMPSVRFGKKLVSRMALDREGAGRKAVDGDGFGLAERPVHGTMTS